LDIFDPEVEPRETLKAIVEGNETPSGKGQKNVRLQANALHGELSSLPDSLSGKLDYLFNPGLADVIEDSEKRSRAKDDLSRLHESSHSIAQEREDIGFGDIIDNLRYKIATRAPLTEEEEDARVRIMTLHSAKGLEADVVVIAGMADQMIPGLKIDQPEEREEQRRLLYVAVTRARDNLIVSWPRRATMKDAKSNFLRTDDGSVFKSEGSVQVRLSKTSFLPTAGYTPVSGDDWLQTELD
jgi:superfamily I DNA/RNA helicase